MKNWQRLTYRSVDQSIELVGIDAQERLTGVLTGPPSVQLQLGLVRKTIEQ
jgi:hypothetical protein